MWWFSWLPSTLFTVCCRSGTWMCRSALRLRSVGFCPPCTACSTTLRRWTADSRWGRARAVFVCADVLVVPLSLFCACVLHSGCVFVMPQSQCTQTLLLLRSCFALAALLLRSCRPHSCVVMVVSYVLVVMPCFVSAVRVLLSWILKGKGALFATGRVLILFCRAAPHAAVYKLCSCCQ